MGDLWSHTACTQARIEAKSAAAAGRYVQPGPGSYNLPRDPTFGRGLWILSQNEAPEQRLPSKPRGSAQSRLASAPASRQPSVGRNVAVGGGRNFGDAGSRLRDSSSD